jgi:2-oxoglutarate dehydrogenase E1 component
MSFPETYHLDLIDSQYQQWKQDPGSVSKDWDFFFQGFEVAAGGEQGPLPAKAAAPASLQTKVERLVFAYRNIGHILSCMDPLEACPMDHPLLSLERFGINVADLDQTMAETSFLGTTNGQLKDLLAGLKSTYCRSIGVEYMHLQDPDERRWLQERMEPVQNKPDLEPREKKILLKQLYQAAMFEAFLNKKYMGVTRFSLEGGDAVIPLLDRLVAQAVENNSREVILGMAHRGRLNVQCHVLGKPYEEIFREFESCYDPGQLLGSGDVKYHNGYLADLQLPEGKSLRMFLVNNPSHLEAVDPVVEGVARARQDLANKGTAHVLPILIHGDAAFAGQGVVAETLNMSQLAGYKTGGTVHIIINNQIGYTTLPEDARSTRYSTDIAKMLMVPIFHVHGENPEAAVHVGKLAADYRHQFGKDVVIDVICYRRYGHNEGDEPYFTQPLMYNRIKERPSLHALYAQELAADNIIDQAYLETLQTEIQGALDKAYDDVHGTDCLFPQDNYFEEWDAIQSKYTFNGVSTGIPKKQLKKIATQLNQVPDGFSLNSKLKRLLDKRMAAIERGKGIDWANAEALAMASILSEGFPIRLSGQDVGRGTFSQRHSVIFDAKTGQPYTPLNNLHGQKANFMVYNSLLAEAGVLGFEYGYSITQPNTLVLWEAQFGDFANNAQGVIDLFIASGQSKWQRLSGLTLLLPHGWEGLGPEHSSARLERFLQLCAEENMQVCNLSTPAQYFHLLRRQVKASFRKPLVLMTPKSLLRHPRAVSPLENLVSQEFETVLDDLDPNPAATEILFCSGKIYYQLVQRREELKQSDKVILRLEQFYPFPETQIENLLAKYKKAKVCSWVQEEPGNMGGWSFVQPRLERIIGQKLRYVGRKPAASPATGFPAIYKQQQEAISDQALGAAADSVS